MANEWVKVELYGANNDGNPRRYTIADGASVSKGQLLSLVDARTASFALATGSMFAGVAAEDHLPSVGVTSISCWTDGIFEAVASDAITIGAAISGNNLNQVIADAASTGAAIIGYALEAAADAEVVNVRLRL